ncbi:hypothetical protein FQN60_004424 [Etheostoma spectabile]|uniref:JmjC domain-containing protein n=1 Tax=Etheostoma spectabile TaxID=54343 RepID=A0A5J5CYQ2_9PERO|nr:hypothetical protein FQN60_004424 [Etheostoma spectabile]
MDYNSAVVTTCSRVLLLCFIGLQAAGPREDGGGWSSDFRLEDEGLCNIDVLDGSSLSHQQFIDRYAYRRPVILRGLTDNTVHYGARRVRLSTANTYSYRKVDVPLQEYVDVLLRPQAADALGSGPGTGVPFHWHGPGYSEVIYGRKVLYFPDRWWHATLNLDTSVFISTFLG